MLLLIVPMSLAELKSDQANFSCLKTESFSLTVPVTSKNYAMLLGPKDCPSGAHLLVAHTVDQMALTVDEP